MKNGKIRIFTTILISLASIVRLAEASDLQENGVLTLDEAIEVALSANPMLKAAQWRAIAADETAAAAGSWMDPMLKIGLMNMPVTSPFFDAEPMSGKQIGIMQKIPVSGRLGAKKAFALADASVALAEKNERVNSIMVAVKKTYFDLVFINRALEITVENIDLLSRFVQIAETRYSVGTGIQQDVLKAQVEVSRMKEKQISLKRMHDGKEAMLNTLMDREPGTPIAVESDKPMQLLDLSESELIEFAVESRPMLEAARHRITGIERRTDFARRLYRPDIDLGVAYTQRDELASGMSAGADFLSLSVGVSLPVKPGNRQARMVEASIAKTRMAQEGYNAALNDVEREIRKHYTEALRDIELIDLYSGRIIPQAEQSLNSAISGYQVDKVDFITLLNNQLTLFNFRISRFKAISDYENALSAIEAAVGKRLF